MGKLFDNPATLFVIVLPVIVVVVLVWLIVRLTRRTEKSVAAVTTPPPGWYPHPDGSTRWWDGTGWTEDTTPGQ